MKSPWEKGTMRVLVACCISLLIGFHTAWAQPHPGETAYGKVCVTCHGPEGAGGLAPALAPMSYEADYVLVNTADPIESVLSSYLLQRTAAAKTR